MISHDNYMAQFYPDWETERPRRYYAGDYIDIDIDKWIVSLTFQFWAHGGQMPNPFREKTWKSKWERRPING